ncbi:MAG TPA: aldehyde dehydrogenase family protein, partial [Planctomycetaceae bacterium]|nr:aldehyde dehydrogenase family protein [Planctomycetaceae bacterium]
SEAIDFVEFYRRCAVSYERMPEIDARGLGVVVVASPWNFPIAIPCGGIAAALASGNTVILKPASDTVLTAYRLCQCFWAGGCAARGAATGSWFGSNRGRTLGDGSRCRCGNPYRWYGDGAASAAAAAHDQLAGGNRRQERHHRDGYVGS